jgi:hypothetical protein
MIIFTLLSFQAQAQVEPDVSYSEEELAEVKDYLMLLQSIPYPCEGPQGEKNCEKNLIYDKATDQIHVIVSDNRKKENGDLDINEILRDPSSYGGDLNSINLREEFANEEHPFDSVQAQFVRDENDRQNLSKQKIKIEVRFADQSLQKEF